VIDPPKYDKNSLVKIAEKSAQHSGDCVVITSRELVGTTWVYEFVIPEQRGSVPEHLIDRLILRDVKL
jgi:hypothetical protein